MAMDATLATKFDNNAGVTLSAGVDKIVKATVGVGAGRLPAERPSRYQISGLRTCWPRSIGTRTKRKTRPGLSTWTMISGRRGSVAHRRRQRMSPIRYGMRPQLREIHSAVTLLLPRKQQGLSRPQL